jgi:hypothetical protein
MATKHSVDEFLRMGPAVGLKVVIEEVDPSRVKVTPWLGKDRCLCEASYVIPKTAIVSVAPTGDLHSCCGSTLPVVEPEFEAEASSVLHSVFAQAIKRVTAISLRVQKQSSRSPTERRPRYICVRTSDGRVYCYQRDEDGRVTNGSGQGTTFARPDRCFVCRESNSAGASFCYPVSCLRLGHRAIGPRWTH